MSSHVTTGCAPVPELAPGPGAPSPIGAPHGDATVRGGRALAVLDRLFTRFDGWMGRVLPEELNPLAQTGAIVNVSLIIATITGVLVMIWYTPSVHQAYDSVEAMHASPFTADLVRSLHRYSSDACMFFALVHALRLIVARRFTGARWLAWVTGVLCIGTLWIVGWTGYWLVWDDRAVLVAQSSARLLDVLPIFAEPFSREFLSDDHVNSLLFFVVFFIHMLVPLLLGILVWLHVVRVARPRFLTIKPLTIWVVASMVLVSLLFPAQSGAPARLAFSPAEIDVDSWYLLPLLAAERLSVGAQWSLLLGVGALLLAVPWMLGERRARVAAVNTSRCDGCRRCAEDCPYNAISMVPHPDVPGIEAAQVDPDRCVGCGICAGSCNRAGVGLDWFVMLERRAKLEQWIDAAGAGTGVAVICAESVADDLHIDAATGACKELPGYVTMAVPCAGWVNATVIERAAKRGAERFLIVSCPTANSRYREGVHWTLARLLKGREPAPRTDKLGAMKVRTIEVAPGEVRRLQRAAERLRAGDLEVLVPKRAKLAVAGAVAAVSLSAVTVLPASVRAPMPEAPSALVVTFKHPGQQSERCVTRTAEELAALPPHMRTPTVCDRSRSDVRLQVKVDGAVVLDGRYAPRGLWGDGNSIALEQVPLPPGRHRVEVALADRGDDGAWPYREEREVEVSARERRVVIFDRTTGFVWR